jgi:WD40 repeat protein
MVRIVRGFRGPVLALAYAPDGSRLYAAGSEGRIRMIDADSDGILAERQVTREWIHSLAVSPDGRTVAAGDSAGAIALCTGHDLQPVAG